MTVSATFAPEMKICSLGLHTLPFSSEYPHGVQLWVATASSLTSPTTWKPSTGVADEASVPLEAPESGVFAASALLSLVLLPSANTTSAAVVAPSSPPVASPITPPSTPLQPQPLHVPSDPQAWVPSPPPAHAHDSTLPGTHFGGSSPQPSSNENAVITGIQRLGGRCSFGSGRGSGRGCGFGCMAVDLYCSAILGTTTWVPVNGKLA